MLTLVPCHRVLFADRTLGITIRPKGLRLIIPTALELQYPLPQRLARMGMRHRLELNKRSWAAQVSTYL